MTNLNTKIINSFTATYPEIFKNISSLKISNKYIKTNDTYSSFQIASIDQLSHLSSPWYIELISNEVWVKTETRLQSGCFSLKFDSFTKLDRLVKFENIKIILLKTIIAQWNYALCKEDKIESSQENYKINDYLHWHYLIKHFTISITSPEHPGFTWDNEEWTTFNWSCFIDVKMSILEQELFYVLQKKLSKFTIEKVNWRRNEFTSMTSLDDFMKNIKWENEYNTMKVNTKSNVFKMGKGSAVYLYFSNTKLEENSADYSSTMIGFKHEKHDVELVICPKVIERKRKKLKKLKPVEKYFNWASGEKEHKEHKGGSKSSITLVQVVPWNNTAGIGKECQKNVNLTTTCNLPKIEVQSGFKTNQKKFQEGNPFEEPLINRENNNNNNNNLDKDMDMDIDMDMNHHHNTNKKLYSDEDDDYNNNTVVNTRPEKTDQLRFRNEAENTLNYTKKLSFEEINSAAKNIYKQYEDEDDFNSFGSIEEEIHTGCFSRLSRIIKESRYPSRCLALSKQWQRYLNCRLINKVIKNHTNVIMKKNTFEKYKIPTLAQFTYTFNIISDSTVQNSPDVQTVYGFNIECFIVCITWVAILSIIYIYLVFSV